MTDWPSLAARFEAADDEAIFSAASDLVDAVWHDADPIKWAILRGMIDTAAEDVDPDPILLLLPVGGCAPHYIGPQSIGDSGMRFAEVAALAAAICRAYAEIERETANDAA